MAKQSKLWSYGRTFNVSLAAGIDARVDLLSNMRVDRGLLELAEFTVLRLVATLSGVGNAAGRVEFSAGIIGLNAVVTAAATPTVNLSEGDWLWTRGGFFPGLTAPVDGLGIFSYLIDSRTMRIQREASRRVWFVISNEAPIDSLTFALNWRMLVGLH